MVGKSQAANLQLRNYGTGESFDESDDEVRNSCQTKNTNLIFTDITYLQNKNHELAKSLAETKNANSQLTADRDYLQRELLRANLKVAKLENYFLRIGAVARSSVNRMMELSNDITSIIQITEETRQYTQCSTDNLSLRSPILNATQSPILNTTQSPNNSKMHAVKPMVGGHVIFRPTINLRRVNPNYLPQSSNSSARNYSNSGGQEEDITNTQSNGFRVRGNGENVQSFVSNRQPIRIRPVDNDMFALEEAEAVLNESSDITPPSSTDSTNVRQMLETLHEEDEEVSLVAENEEIDSANVSLNIQQHHNSAVPLLSGVFKEVRVYLSPIQNVTKQVEQTKSVAAKMPRQKKLPKKSDLAQPNETTQPLTMRIHETNKPLSSSHQEIPNNSTNHQSDLAISFQKRSYDDSNENSSSTSKKVIFPHAQNVDGKLQKDFRGILKSSLAHCSNDTENMSCDVTKKISDTTVIDDSKNVSFLEKSEPSQASSSNDTVTALKKKTSVPISSSTLAARVNDYDPIEGPSTLLDTINQDNDSRKIDTLNILGLRPVDFQNNTSTPVSPPRKLRKRKVKEPERSTPTSSRTQSAQNTPPTSPTSDNNINVTKRKVIEKKKSKRAQSAFPKVVIKRTTAVSRKVSLSPRKRVSINTLQSGNSPATTEPTSVVPLSHIDAIINSVSSTPTAPDSTSKPSKAKRSKKSRATASTSTASNVTTSSAVESPKPRTSVGKSPKPKRQKRTAHPTSFKEPSLRKKLRRSK